MKRIITLVLTTLATQVYSAEPVTELTVYTAIETGWLSTYKNAFEHQYPNIKIKWVRDSTGIITSKLIAEKKAPKADVVMGVAATSLLVLDQNKMLATYQPKDYPALDNKMKDRVAPINWIGMNAWASAVCINKPFFKKNRLPLPKTWLDLTKPIYKNMIVAPNPASSGTGYMNASAWIQLWGEKQAWQYMDQLNKNIKMYTHSGNKSCAMVAHGEAPMGLSSAAFANTLIKHHAPILAVLPDKHVGWEMEAAAIIKGTSKLAAAKKLMDFNASKTVAEIAVKFSGISARSTHVSVEGQQALNAMIDNDIDWAMQNRQRIIKEFSKRYTIKK